MTLAGVVGQNGRDEGLTNVIAHRNDARVFRGYLKAFLDGGNGAIEIGIGHGEDAAHNAIEQNVGRLIGKAAGRRTIRGQIKGISSIPLTAERMRREKAKIRT